MELADTRVDGGESYKGVVTCVRIIVPGVEIGRNSGLEPTFFAYDTGCLVSDRG